MILYITKVQEKKFSLHTCKVTQCVSLRTEIKQFFKKKKKHHWGQSLQLQSLCQTWSQTKCNSWLTTSKTTQVGKKNFPGQCLTCVTFMKKEQRVTFFVPAPPACLTLPLRLVSGFHCRKKEKGPNVFPSPFHRLCPRVLKHLPAHLHQHRLLLLHFLSSRVKG